MAYEMCIGKKVKKAWRMKPKKHAGRPATGKGEWRSMARKAKTVKVEAPKDKEKKR